MFHVYIFFLFLHKTLCTAKQNIAGVACLNKKQHNTATDDQGKHFFFFPNDDTNYITLFTSSAVMDVRVCVYVYIYLCIYVFSIIEVEFFLAASLLKKKKKKMQLSISVQRGKAALLVAPLAWLASVEEQHR